jgi:hypothetical protein
VQGVLLAFYGSAASGLPSTIRGIPVIAGFLLSIAWYLVLRRGKAYVARWETVVSRIEQEATALSMEPSIPLLRYFHNAQASEPSHRLGFLNMETSTLMKGATVITGAIWVLAGVVLLIHTENDTPLRCQVAPASSQTTNITVTCDTGAKLELQK